MRGCIGNLTGVAVAGILLAACGGKEQPKTSAQGQGAKQSIAALSKAASSNAGSQATAPVPPPPGTPAPPESVAVSQPPAGLVNQAGEELGLAKIKEALKVFVRDAERFPNSLEEMVKSGVIERIPTPPAGKKYVLDPKMNDVLLVNNQP